MNERIDYVLRRSTYQGENGLQVVKHRAGCFFFDTISLALSTGHDKVLVRAPSGCHGRW